MNQIVRFGCSLRMPRSWRSDGLWQEVTCLPRLTERLDELELFTAACREGREGPAALCAPTYTHPFLTAGFLANEPWLQPCRWLWFRTLRLRARFVTSWPHSCRIERYYLFLPGGYGMGRKRNPIRL